MEPPVACDFQKVRDRLCSMPSTGPGPSRHLSVCVERMDERLHLRLGLGSHLPGTGCPSCHVTSPNPNLHTFIQIPLEAESETLI